MKGEVKNDPSGFGLSNWKSELTLTEMRKTVGKVDLREMIKSLDMLNLRALCHFQVEISSRHLNICLKLRGKV